MVKGSAVVRSAQRRGFSLLEAMAASGMMAALLVPTLATMRYAMVQSEDATLRRFLAHYAVLKLEEACAEQIANWQSGDAVATFVATEFKVATKTSDALADGGVPGRLMVVETVAWFDANGNGSVDAGEAHVNMASKVSRLQSYGTP
jgi:type II secretory pathway pseudopilin PulG